RLRQRVLPEQRRCRLTPRRRQHPVSKYYLRNLLVRRSASGLPPVWQVGQYCRDESAKETSRTTSPQTGHFSPVWPWTAMWDFFSPLSSEAARPVLRSTAPVRVS